METVHPLTPIRMDTSNTRTIKIHQCLLVLISGFFSSAVSADEFTEKIVPLLQEHCYDCHDGDSGKPKGDFDLFPFYTTEDAKDDLKAMQRLRNALHFHEMPPAEKSQPSDDEQNMVIGWINQQLLHHRAFRRPVSDEEIAPYLAIYENALAGGTSRESATAEAIRAVLSSPRFLLIAENAGGDGAVRRLDGYEIANRLSYFLWASMPDDELFAAAENGELDTSAGIEKQAHRMLRDPKSKELSDSFAYQWLRLNVLLGSQPNARRFPKFYAGTKGKETLAAPMLQETLLLFETCLIENRPLFDLIDPDFTWLNPRLIQFYGFETEFAEHLASAESLDKNGRKRLDQSKWFRCQLPDRKRGGILCMGSTLTLTSLPLRTSPVYRGAWVTEVLFNRPPPPPPAMVDELGADDEAMQDAGLTLRQKLEQHREKAACAGCHTRIDPLGFPLEKFDAIGQWRESYGKFPIDSGGKLMNRYAYRDVVEFKDVLAERKADFHRGFIQQLLTYGLGRHLEPADEIAIVEVAAIAEKGGLQDVIVAVATSYPFTHARANP